MISKKQNKTKQKTTTTTTTNLRKFDDKFLKIVRNIFPKFLTEKRRFYVCFFLGGWGGGGVVCVGGGVYVGVGCVGVCVGVFRVAIFTTRKKGNV